MSSRLGATSKTARWPRISLRAVQQRYADVLSTPAMSTSAWSFGKTLLHAARVVAQLSAATSSHGVPARSYSMSGRSAPLPQNASERTRAWLSANSGDDRVRRRRAPGSRFRTRL